MQLHAGFSTDVVVRRRIVSCFDGIEFCFRSRWSRKYRGCCSSIVSWRSLLCRPSLASSAERTIAVPSERGDVEILILLFDLFQHRCILFFPITKRKYDLMNVYFCDKKLLRSSSLSATRYNKPRPSKSLRVGTESRGSRSPSSRPIVLETGLLLLRSHDSVSGCIPFLVSVPRIRRLRLHPVSEGIPRKNGSPS